MIRPPLAPLPPSFASTRDTVHGVTVHVLARARHAATGRFGLRATPGGWGTPAFGDQVRAVRIGPGGTLVVEHAASGAASTRVAPIDGSTLRALADVAGIDLTAPLDVGHDTPAVPDPDATLSVDPHATDQIGAWFAFVEAVLVATMASHPHAEPSVVQLWPEHFDLAVDLKAGTDRVNVGGSPGDGYHAAPYLYVGPWSADRPSDPEYWNAPFGAVLTYDRLLATDDPRSAARAFIDRGLELLAGTVG